MTGFICFSFMAAREAGCLKQKSRGGADFVLFHDEKRNPKQVSVCVGWLLININDGNIINFLLETKVSKKAI